MWVAFIAVLGWQHSGQIQELALFADLQTLWTAVSPLARGVILGFCSYLLGVVAVAVQDGVAASKPARWVQSMALGKPGKAAQGLRTWYIKVTVSPSPRTRALVRSMIQERFSEISPVMPQFVPDRIVLDEFELAEIRLLQEAPDQYQSYDRLRAEAEFRSSVWVPALALVILIGFSLPLVPGAAFLVLGVCVSAVLAVQGHKLRGRAEEYMASALYFGFTSTPMLAALERQMREDVDESSLHDSGGGPAYEVASVLKFIFNRSLQDGILISKMRHPSQSRLVSEAEGYMSKELRSLIDWVVWRDGDRHAEDLGLPSDDSGEKSSQA